MGLIARKLHDKSTKLARPAGVTTAPHPPNRAGRLLFIATEKIQPNPHQPRSGFDPAALEELAASLKEHGVLQPLTVQLEGETPVLIAGERRLRAAKLAGLDSLPCVVRETGDDAAVLALVENLHRRDLTPLETAEALARIKARGGLDLAGLAKLAGKAKSTVSEVLSLAGLPDEVKAMAGQRPERFPQRLLVELAKVGGPYAVSMATSVRNGKRTPEEMHRQLREERRPAPPPLPLEGPEPEPAPAGPPEPSAPPAQAEQGGSAPCAPEPEPGPDTPAAPEPEANTPAALDQDPAYRVAKVRGVPVRIAADGSLHAVLWNYFPVSHTGYLSGASQGSDPAYWTSDKLEALARERDQERATTIRDAARALKRVEPFFGQGGPLVNPIDVGLGLTAILASAVGRAWLAPENEQAKLLALAAELAEALFKLPSPNRAARSWTPEKWEARRAWFKDWPEAIAQAREGEWLPLALAYRVGRNLPQVVADALGIDTYEAPPRESGEKAPASIAGGNPDAGGNPQDGEGSSPAQGAAKGGDPREGKAAAQDTAGDLDAGCGDLAGQAAARRADRHAAACADHAGELATALGHLEAARLGKVAHTSLRASLEELVDKAGQVLAALKDCPPVDGKAGRPVEVCRGR